MKLQTMKRVYLREAIIVLLLARLALRLLPPSRVFGWVNRPLRRARRFVLDDVSWIAWAIEDVGARPWMNASCLPRALAAYAMLRRRGIASRLCLGVARKGNELAAHAWVEIGGKKIVGGPEADGFTRLAVFGAAR